MSVGGDIAKQMPMEAKKFAKIDKEWAKVMGKLSYTCIYVYVCVDRYTYLPQGIGN